MEEEEGTRTKDEQHEDDRISRTYILAAYQWWTLTTGVRSWRLATVVMTGHIRGGIAAAALNHPSLERERERFHLSTHLCERSVDTYLDAGFFFARVRAKLVMGPARARKW